MINLDYSKLQPLSANNTQNKQNKAIDNEDCKAELEKYLENFKTYMLSQNVYDMSSLLIAEQDWLRRHSTPKVFSECLVGKILRVDFGKMYLCENGLIHYAICIAEHQGKYCVIPMTTSNDEIKMAFHPQYRPNGEKRLFLLKRADGNVKDSALYINDLKYISSGRIIKVGNKIADEAYNNIINLVCELLLPNIQTKVIALKTENDVLTEKNKALAEKNKLLELLVKNTQKSN